ncbi:MAG: hypothetical protein Kow0060_06900 [Methylohalobius crimeensis]
MNRQIKYVIAGVAVSMLAGQCFAANDLFRQNFNQIIGSSLPGFNPFYLGTTDGLVDIVRNGNSAFITSPGGAAGLAGVMGRLNQQAVFPSSAWNGGWSAPQPAPVDWATLQWLQRANAIFSGRPPAGVNPNFMINSSAGFYGTPFGAVPSGMGFSWCGVSIC